MKKVSTVLKTLLVLTLLAIGWVWSGLYNVAADASHTRPVFALLELLRQRSVAVRASAIEIPALDEEALIRAGAGPEEHPHDAGAAGASAGDGHDEEHEHGDHPHKAAADTPEAAPQPSLQPKE